MAFGRFERLSPQAPICEINVTPLVDVMMVLVVILIITAPLLASAIRMQLPGSEAAQPGTPAHFVSLALDAQGQIYLDDTPQDLPALARRLAEVARQHPDTEVQLRADASVPYGRVIEVMGEAQKAGLSHVGFVAEARPTPPAR